MSLIYFFLGFYTRVSEYDEVKEKVFHYIEVMARPMVMYQNDHPVQWTPAYVGGKVMQFKATIFF